MNRSQPKETHLQVSSIYLQHLNSLHTTRQEAVKASRALLILRVLGRRVTYHFTTFLRTNAMATICQHISLHPVAQLLMAYSIWATFYAGYPFTCGKQKGWRPTDLIASFCKVYPQIFLKRLDLPSDLSVVMRLWQRCSVSSRLQAHIQWTLLCFNAILPSQPPYQHVPPLLNRNGSHSFA